MRARQSHHVDIVGIADGKVFDRQACCKAYGLLGTVIYTEREQVIVNHLGTHVDLPRSDVGHGGHRRNEGEYWQVFKLERVTCNKVEGAVVDETGTARVLLAERFGHAFQHVDGRNADIERLWNLPE